MDNETLDTPQLSFTPETDAPVQLSFTPDGTRPPPDDTLAQTRASKISYGLNKPREDVLPVLQAGREDMLRQQAATESDLDWQKNKRIIMEGIVKKAAADGRTLTPEQYDTLSSMSKADFETDPNTVFEKKYAQKYIKDQVVASTFEAPKGIWAKAFEENPTATAQNMRIFANQGAKAEVINTLNEDMDSEARQRGVFQTIGGMIWGATPGVSWVNHARLMQEAPWSATSLPGTIKREQINYLLSLPLDKFQPAAKAAINDLKAVSFDQAKEFAEALKKYSTSDEFLMSSTGVLDASLLPLGRVARGLGKLAEASSARIFPTRVPKEPGLFDYKASPEFYGTGKINLDNLPPIKEVVQDTLRKEKFEPTQLDLFPNTPRQLDLFGGSRLGENRVPLQDQRGPITTGLSPNATADDLGRIQSSGSANTAGLEPGKLRSTFKPLDQQAAESEAASMRTGRNPMGKFEPGQGRYRQEEMDFGPEGQRNLDLQAPTKPTLTKPTVTPDNLSGGLGKTFYGHQAQEGLDRMTSLASYSKAAGVDLADRATKAAESGNTAQAAIYGAMERLGSPLWKDAPIRPVEMPLSSHDINNYFGNARSMAQAKKNELMQQAQERDLKWNSQVDEALRTRRLPEAVEKQAFLETQAKMYRNYGPKYGDGVLDVVYLPSYLFKANVGHAVMRLGDNTTKLPFRSKDQAELFAKDIYKLAPDEYKIYVNAGDEYFIGLRASIAENTDRTYNAIANLKNAVVQKGLFAGIKDALLNVRMVDSYLDPASNAQRKVAAHAQQGMKALILDASKTFSSLGSTARKEVETVLNDYGNKRKWFETGDDFAEAFLNRHKKAPTDEQINSAYVYKQLQDHDFMVRNMGMYRDMARQGTEQISLLTKTGASDFFNGIQRDGLPWGRGEDFTIALYKSGADNATVGFAHEASRFQGKLNKDEIERLIKDENYQVIHVFSPSDKPLSKILPGNDEHINYIVTDAFKNKPLNWQQLKYEPGPHSIYKDDFFVKQPKMATGHLGKTIYYGDNTLWSFRTEAEGKKWLERLNVAREKVNAGATDAESYIVKNLPYASRNEFLKLKSQFDFDVPFSMTQRGRSVFETQLDLENQFPGAINFHKSSHNPQNFMDRTFVQERDELLNNPVDRQGVLRFEQSQQLDSFHALERGLNQSIRNMWLNDEKVRAITNWIENYKNVIDIANVDQMRATPLWTFYNAKLKKTALNESYDMYAAAEAERKAIQNFVGQQSELGNAMGRLKTSLMNSVYDNAGHDAAIYASDLPLGFIKDPASYFRSFAANAKIGLFNPIPLIQQAMTYTNIAAIVPEHALRSLAASQLMHSTGFTAEEAIMNSAAKMSEKFGWKAAEFKEMNEAFRMTNLEYVGKEAAFRHDNFDPTLFASKMGTILGKGFTFFNMGERFTRKAAFAAGYAEWRAANPAAKLTEGTIAGIQQRADTLTGHMTSASLSNLQNNGFASLGLQFTTYYNHMAQLMMGKELTGVEKLRLLAVNGALFGVPAAVGIGGYTGAAAGLAGSVLQGRGPLETGLATVGGALGMWPVYDDIMEYAQANGKDMSNLGIQALMKGLPNVLAQVVLHKDPDIAKNYALGNNGLLRDMLRQDKGFFEVIMGASGSVVGDVLESSYPAAIKIAKATMGQSAFGPLQATDFERSLRNIGTADLATRIWAAANYGQYETRKGVVISGLDTMDTILTALRLSPKQVQETYLIQNVQKNQKKAQDDFENLMLESFRRADQAANRGDWKKYEEYTKDAEAYGTVADFNFQDRQRIGKRALQESRGIDENALRNYMRKAPESTQINRMQQFYRNHP